MEATITRLVWDGTYDDARYQKDVAKLAKKNAKFCLSRQDTRRSYEQRYGIAPESDPNFLDNMTAEADRFCNIYRHTYRRYVEQPTWTPPAPELEAVKEPTKLYHIQKQDVTQRGSIEEGTMPVLGFKRSPHYQPYTSLMAAKRAAVEGWDDSYKGAPDALISAMYVRFRRLGHIRIEHEKIA